jgi:hypothetical protein
MNLCQETPTTPTDEEMGVAKAIALSDGFNWDALLEGDRVHYSCNAKVYVRRARAAILAMSRGSARD